MKSSEKSWVEFVAKKIQKDFTALGVNHRNLRAKTGYRLPYAFEVFRYKDKEPLKPKISAYETDLLLYEEIGAGTWIPRVVIECKLSKVSTHDALTYSTKASTHKHVHPYLRYGILVGSRKDYAIPGRLFRHGAFFDFMVTWAKAKPSEKEWIEWMRLLRKEIATSRTTEALLVTNRKRSRARHTLIQRHLVMDNK